MNLCDAAAGKLDNRGGSLTRVVDLESLYRGIERFRILGDDRDTRR